MLTHQKGEVPLELEYVLPQDIERRSFSIIEEELGNRQIPEQHKPIVMRVIHTTADFDYYDNLQFSPDVVSTALELLQKGATIVTDTNMARSGINKGALQKLNCEALCFMSDPEVAEAAKLHGTTRATASVDKAATLEKPIIYAVGNAPTALIRLYEHITEGTFLPAMVIGAPVGFVNVVQSKELLMKTSVPHIVAKGRKGGSNVAAAICNALLYLAGGRSSLF